MAAAPGCYTTGDRLCDTAPDDPCMTGFSDEQARRMRSTLATYRPALAEIAAR